MTLKDSNGKQVTLYPVTSISHTLYPYIKLDLDAGTYYLDVSRSVTGGTGKYNVQANFSPF